MENKIVRWNDQPILTTKQIAERLGVNENNLKNNFNNQSQFYIKGIDYFLLEGEELKEFKNYVKDFDLVEKHTRSLYLWTESGFLNHVKSIGTEEAWDVFKKTKESYFEMREHIKQQRAEQIPQMTEMEMIAKIATHSAELEKKFLVHDGKLDEHTEVLNDLQEKVDKSITLVSKHQRQIQKAINYRAVELSENDKSKRKLVFPLLHRAFRDAFGVTSYKDIAYKDLDEAMKFVQGWRPPASFMSKN